METQHNKPALESSISPSPHLLTLTISSSPSQAHSALLKTDQQMSSGTTSANSTEASKKRDDLLAKVNQDRTYSHIKAWEENKKAKALNKLNRKIAKIKAWENTSKTMAESRLKRAEENVERMKAAHVERMKNKMAEVHRQAEERRAIAEAEKGKDLLKVEDLAAKYKAAGYIPRRFLCFQA